MAIKSQKPKRAKAGAVKPTLSRADVAKLQKLNEERTAVQKQLDRTQKRLVQLQDKVEDADRELIMAMRRLNLVPGEADAAPLPKELAGEPPPHAGARGIGRGPADPPQLALARGAIAAGAPEEGPTPSTTLAFSEFLTGMSEGMISAQQRLDLQSEAYIAGSSVDRPLPTLFRLPRLKADVKFALEMKEGKKMNLLFYSSASAANSLQQHSMEFELIAVPPPPESGLVPGRYVPLMPRLEMIVERSTRLRWLALMFGDDRVRAGLALDEGASALDSWGLLLWQFVRPGRKVEEGKVLPELFLLGNVADDVAQIVLVEASPPRDGAESPTPGTIILVQPLSVLLKGTIATWLQQFLKEVSARQWQLFTGKAGP